MNQDMSEIVKEGEGGQGTKEDLLEKMKEWAEDIRRADERCE